jgi:1-acyl-sn-glycerol-3-phosphate acyltransferase
MEILPYLLWLLSPAAHLILWIFGWKPLTRKYIKAFKQHPKKVVIFPHTTYWDFPILAIYSLTIWSEYHDGGVHVVMKPQLVNGPFGKFFRAFNCLAATPKHETGAGFVSKTTEKMARLPRFTIFISPDGTTRRSEWKTGYFYLAKELGCVIQVVGLDYHNHCPVIKPAVVPGDLEATQKILKEQIATIPTLNPEQSVVPSPNVETSLYPKDHLHITLPPLISIGIIIWNLLYLAFQRISL